MAQYVDELGQTWYKGGGKGGVSKGTGKGKGKSGGERKGKGKGHNEEHRGRQIEVTPRKPTAYYFDLYPDRAKGRKVIKCHMPTCFGCWLEGDHPPTECRFCHTPCRRSGSNTGSDKTVREKPEPAAKPVEYHNGGLAAKAYQGLLDKGQAEDEALKFVQETLGFSKYRPKK